MTRDFAKKTRRPASNKRSSGNTRSSNRRPASKPKSQVPGWVWLFTGTVLGAFIMFLAYLAGIAPQPTNPQPIAAEDQPEQTKPQVPKPRFDFYQLLKESEVEVKEPTPAQREAAKEQAENQEYILQVGSFRKDSDADRLRAQLILLNLDAQVEKVTVRSGETWYRVLVGPYSNSSKMERARSILASNRINSLLLKRKQG
ncbi:SPOR domain-containing protein [Aestuariicella sp. G3-2]|uniref:SPOR domain-containing protein n=1 Tax=Pseudomaricurvus albidus TaxID=2842452 RepID=UPI001C0BF0E5|nr:SPOR domain-containing protein [Aestuariicella albida]MBU3068365.1 SPOR domain-containing protein [Aestuariicella albida]